MLNARVLFALVIACATAGCDGKFPDFGAADKAASNRTSMDDVARKLLADYQENDQFLLVISSRQYNCGTLTEHKLYGDESPSGLVEAADKKRKALIGASMDILDNYANALAAFKKKEDGSPFIAGMIKNGSTIGSNGGFSAVGEAITLIFSGLQQAETAGKFLELNALARAADQPPINKDTGQPIAFAQGALTGAINQLKENYKIYADGALNAFGLWDRCAREKWFYIKQTNSKDGLINPDTHKPYPRLGMPPSAIELENSWKTYRDQRASYVASIQTETDYKQSLDAIKALNDKLKTASSWDASGGDVADLVNTLSSVYKATKDGQQQLYSATTTASTTSATTKK